MKSYIVLFILILAACAPADLDITPTAVPTDVPQIEVYITGAVNQPQTTHVLDQGSRVRDAIDAAGGATDDADLDRVNLVQELRDGDQVHIPAQGEAAGEPTATPAGPQVPQTQALLEEIVASLPGTINAGMIIWRRDLNTEVAYVERDGGITARVTFNEAGGGLMELTYGVFETPEQAMTYYETSRDQLPTLDRAEERDQFPTPNAFGGGTYGSDAIFVRDNVFIRVSVPRFSSTAGDPLNPMARPVFAILDDVLASSETE
ncbi:MAG: hypothetical protein CL610_16865 [Anaerolineaceae bacterium]|nr:hypothetical protein [Anaerolineaceae bacterium]